RAVDAGEVLGIGWRAAGATGRRGVTRAGATARRCLFSRHRLSRLRRRPSCRASRRPLPIPPHKGEGAPSGVWHDPAPSTAGHLPPCGGGWEGGATRTAPWEGVVL